MPAFPRNNNLDNNNSDPDQKNDDSQYIQKSLAEELEQQFLAIDQKSSVPGINLQQQQPQL